MYIKSITFSKKPKDGNGWKIEECNLKKINLITGKNASGKTRLLQSINTLAELLFDGNGSLINGYTFHWNITLTDDNQNIDYELEFENNIIIKEKLTIDDIIYFQRDNEGKGNITYESLNNDKVDFEIEQNKIVLKTKRDKKQHPSMEVLFSWVKSVYLYKFGSKLGRDMAMPIKTSMDDQLSKNDDAVVIKYEDGFRKGGDKFKENIISDINSIGYNIKDIGTTVENKFKEFLQNSTIPVPSLLFIKEDNVEDKIFQNEISQGMFRALSLIIQIRYLEYNDSLSPCIIIDDIGEGLDFERSTKLISYIIKKAKVFEDQMQLIMTTNDRFVMNSIDLDYWIIIDKIDNKIQFYNNETHHAAFKKFKKIGLNNFDFFTSEYYKEL